MRGLSVMPTKKQKETPEVQSERFRAEVERLVAAGELDPIEADKAFESLVSRIVPKQTVTH